MSDPENQRAIHYSNDEITIVWKPSLCQGSTRCWKNLPEVFHHKERPWITVDGADTDTIVKQVAQCPSGALTIIDHRKT